MKRLLVFLKYPTPGRVKTRLASALGAEAAAAVSRASAMLTLEGLAARREDVVVCIDPPEAIGRSRAWLKDGWRLRPQRGADLGERLAEATAAAFQGGAHRVAVIGTDSPWLSASDIDEAFQSMDHAEVVLGPAEDGGYYLIGLTRPVPGLFGEMAWGSDQVFAQTSARARGLGLRVHLLRRGYDIDRPEDLRRFLEETRGRGETSPTLRHIERLLE